MTWLARRWGGIAIGVVLSVAAGALYATGVLDRLSDAGTDFHLRYLGDVPADSRIVLVDIDDQSLGALGDWPWDRRLYADLVNTLQELGAKSIVLDVILAEPTAPRIKHSGLGRDYDVDTGLTELGDRASDPPIYDDDELRDSVKNASVYLPMYAPLAPPGRAADFASQNALELVKRQPGITPDQFRSQVDLPLGWSAERALAQARIALILGEDFTRDETAVAAALGGDSTQTRRLVRENLAAAKRLAAERAARRFFDSQSDGALPAFLQSVLPTGSVDALSADRRCLIDAFRAARSREIVGRLNSRVPASLGRRIQHAYDAVYPLDKFAEAAGGIGFVAFGREELDGVLRSVPMVVDVEGALVPQLGLLVATKLLGADTSSVRYEGNALIVDAADRRLNIPIDREGRTLINWHVPKAAGGHCDWRDSFSHIPAAVILEISSNRRTMADNDRRLTLAKAELLQTRHAETGSEFARYVDLIRRRDDLIRRTGPGGGGQTVEPVSQDLEGVRRQISEMEADAMIWLRRAEALWRNAEPQNEAEIAERGKIHRLHESFNDGRLASRIAESNRRLEVRNAELQRELASPIGGKVCLVGYTASGVADLITSPIHAQAPGVIAHANIINMVLQNRFISEASPGWNVAFVVIAGLAATIATCVDGWRFSLAALVAAGVVFLTAGAAAFRLGSVLTASLPAVAALACVWSGATLYRQSTEERARRRLHRALTQYTSPAIAARIAERLDRSALAPHAAKVTCFFSDLRGFTGISERLGPERTRDVLNPYLETVSRILVEHGAMVNKFVGDGIFAFFNAPIRACPEHERKACEAALAALNALDGLNRALSRGLDGEPLAMRIGLSTGEAFVGDYGSEMKLDYTCIGDTVNLGSRLEQANKTLATSVLVDDRTYDGADGAFAFRPIGRVAVAGRSAPACVYELVGHTGEADPNFALFRNLSARAIAHYQACEWDSCLAVLGECRALRPDDCVVALYARSIETLRRVGRPTGWDGTIKIGATEVSMG